MTIRLITEDGRRLVSEAASGISGASSLNDTRVEVISKEEFTTNPLSNGWLLGNNWVWDGAAGNMESA